MTTDPLLISAQEVAKRLDIALQSVYALVDSGTWIGSQRAGNKPVISRAAFNRLYGDGIWMSDQEPITNPFVINIHESRKQVAS